MNDVPLSSGSGSGSGSNTPRSRAARGAASSLAAAAAAAAPSSSVLEPEMFAFSHFCSVLRALACAWDEDRLLRVYELSVQRAAHRSVSLEDFVTTVRCFGIMPVDVDWGRLENEEEEMHSKAKAEAEEKARRTSGGTEPISVELPSLDLMGSGSGGPSGSTAAASSSVDEHSTARKLLLKLREVEATAHSKLDHAVRRHEKELVQTKAAHEREMQQLQQMHQQQLELHRRAMEAERARAAADYNALFASSSQELRALQRLTESSESKHLAHSSASVAHFSAKLAEESRMLQLVQAKLTAKTDKLHRKKQQLADMTKRATKAEQTLATLVQAQQQLQANTE